MLGESIEVTAYVILPKTQRPKKAKTQRPKKKKEKIHRITRTTEKKETRELSRNVDHAAGKGKERQCRCRDVRILALLDNCGPNSRRPPQAESQAQG